MNDSKKGNLPMRHGVQLNKSQCPTTSVEMNKMKDISYISAIGSIMREPLDCSEGHLEYLRRTKYVFLVYGGDDELVVTGYTDASFRTDKVLEQCLGEVPSNRG
ncbi:hypothetical protein LIER_16264 [Lithospermum erythrorhizon]|uniref:Uncharacterized protein n=1 Tax=Lithospermum erythrorhizon TaxID=34254 RepID=A0AAV3Q8H5_LITER